MNRKSWPVLFLTVLMTLLFVLPAQAQFSTHKKKKKKTTHKTEKKKSSDDNPFDEGPKKFKDHLWYGGGLNLGFQGYNGGSIFQLGLSPMVGYKIWGPFSAGPRISSTLISVKQPGAKAFTGFDWELGAFTRAKFGPIFVHGELSNSWTVSAGDYDFSTQKWSKFYYQRLNKYLGLGYNNSMGGVGFGYEIMALYNFALTNETQTGENPFGLRVGFTWNF